MGDVDPGGVEVTSFRGEEVSRCRGWVAMTRCRSLRKVSRWRGFEGDDEVLGRGVEVARCRSFEVLGCGIEMSKF